VPEHSTLERAERKAKLAVGEGRRLIAKDKYVFVLGMIVTTILASAFLGDGLIGNVITLVFLTLTLVLTFSTSQVGPRLQWLGAGVAVLSIIGVVVGDLLGHHEVAKVAFFVAMISLSTITPVVIARRISKHLTITLDTVAGAADIYLLVGLLFATLYALIGSFDAGVFHAGQSFGSAPVTPATAFFISARTADSADFIYYSFVTLTTVGYGDLTSAGEFGRMLSVVEALFGQLYLVIVVSIIVANIGRTRSRRANGSVEPETDASDA
jgi:hypothetical protein